MDEVEAYYTHIRRGNAADSGAACGAERPVRGDCRRRIPASREYERPGGGLQDKLEQLAPGRYACYQGLKHARPYIEDGVEQMAA